MSKELDSRKKQLLELLNQFSIESNKQFVLNLVSWLDIKLSKQILEDDDWSCSLELQIFVKAFYSCGSFFKHLSTVNKTIEAAISYLENPSELSYDFLVITATNSYPFGPGDGCYAIPELGFKECEVGSGCRSGSGTLAIIAEQVGYDLVANRIRDEIIRKLSS